MAAAMMEGSLTEEEMDECIKDSMKAYSLYEEFVKSDRLDTGVTVVQEIKRFKRHLKLREEVKKLEKEHENLGP